ncbi:hypothetical protein DXG03_000658 [Asterophora parasitica]|uniref:Uncharacterized protein n=1 Tax=Asterophora parasitica TaxID=117018 RepID=A0A9P7G633_9AGAR|nr:hypothetical protein DXG03_000658 [Asterophora parasitica]
MKAVFYGPDSHQYYRVLGSNLQELDLHQPQSGIVDLSPNDNLRELWFHSVEPALDSEHWVLDALRTITSIQIHRITIYLRTPTPHVDYTGRACLEDFDWSTLTDLLSTAPFSPALQNVKIVLEHPSQYKLKTDALHIVEIVEETGRADTWYAGRYAVLGTGRARYFSSYRQQIINTRDLKLAS